MDADPQEIVMRPVPTAAGRWPPFGRNAGPASNRKPGRFHLGMLDRFPTGVSGRFESELAHGQLGLGDV